MNTTNESTTESVANRKEEILPTPEERVEADREHLRKQHGFFISRKCPIDILQLLHMRDHAKEQKTEFYKPHEHQVIETGGIEESTKLSLE